MKLVLFLGSGVSLLSGLPSVGEIMELLQRSPVFMDENERLRSGKTPAPAKPQDIVAQVRSFLRLLATLDEEDRKKAQTVFRTATTYEDLSAICLEIRDWANGQSDDALTTTFIEMVERRAGSILLASGRRARMMEICQLAYYSQLLIQFIVANALRPQTPVGFNLILELAASRGVDQLDIVTLNHDTLVEHLLSDAGIQFVDGFSAPDGDVRWYDETVYDGSSRVRLIKLHGSINWYEFSRGNRSWPAILLRGGPATAKDGKGQGLRSWSQTPMFLTGGRKEAWYQHGIYADLHYHFHYLLRQSDRIVMSGYGWADVGINNQLEQWLARDHENRIILLHEAPETLLERSKILAESYDALIRRRQVVPVQRWLSNTSLADIAPEIRL